MVRGRWWIWGGKNGEVRKGMVKKRMRGRNKGTSRGRRKQDKGGVMLKGQENRRGNKF